MESPVMKLKVPTSKMPNNIRTLQHISDHIEKNVKWSNRKSRVFIPYFGRVDKPEEFRSVERHEYVTYGLSKECTVCDVQTSYQTHTELWRSFGEYKYVLSPRGAGHDCDRNYQILMMGAIPVIPFWTGATAYSYANMSVITIRQTSDINEKNIKLWDQIFHHGTERYKLTRSYMNKYAFDSSTILMPGWSYVEHTDK